MSGMDWLIVTAFFAFWFGLVLPWNNRRQGRKWREHREEQSRLDHEHRSEMRRLDRAAGVDTSRVWRGR